MKLIDTHEDGTCDIKISDEERLALRKLLGANSWNSLREKGLSDDEARTVLHFNVGLRMI